MAESEYRSGGVASTLKIANGIRDPKRVKEVANRMLMVIDEENDPIVKIKITNYDGMTTTIAYCDSIEVTDKGEIFICCKAGV